MRLDEARKNATMALMTYKSVLLKEAERVHNLLEIIGDRSYPHPDGRNEHTQTDRRANTKA